MEKPIFKIFTFIFLLTVELTFSQKNNDIVNNNRLKTIENLVNDLKSKNDSLNKKIISIERNDYKSFEVIDKVNNYYENAWNKLIYFITAIGGILIFVIPYVLNRFQKREIKLKKEEFEEYVDSKIGEFEKKIIEFNKQEIIKIKKEIKTLNKNINDNQDKKIAELYAMTYYLQGLHSINNNNTDLTIKSLITSIKNLLKANTNKNLKLTLNLIDLEINKKIKSKEKLTENVVEDLNKIFVEINEKFDGIYIDEIIELKGKIK